MKMARRLGRRASLWRNRGTAAEHLLAGIVVPGRVLTPRKPCKCQAIGARPARLEAKSEANRADRDGAGVTTREAKTARPEGFHGPGQSTQPGGGISRPCRTDGTIWVGKTRLHDAGIARRCRRHVRTGLSASPHALRSATRRLPRWRHFSQEKSAAWLERSFGLRVIRAAGYPPCPIDRRCGARLW
jgi:hypothetical protein